MAAIFRLAQMVIRIEQGKEYCEAGGLLSQPA
jgi:hypothetical protein